MSEEKKVICPWCGEEMWLKTDGIGWWYECNACSAQSPNENGNASALDAALDMYKPLQKPLTLEEAKKELALWFEYPPNIFNPRACLLPELYSSDYRDESKYGYAWRCWATKPTDEERRAAAWDE